MVFVVCRAAASDAFELMQLEATLFDNAMTEEMVVRELTVGEGFVARQTNDPAAPILGYVLVRADGELLDVTRVGVLAEAQCLGIGTALLKSVLERRQATVLTVKKSNARALRLYKRHGFRVVGHFAAERAWVLRRDALPSDHSAT